MAAKKRAFGTVQQLPSGRYRTRYRHPTTHEWVSAPKTFDWEGQADAWLRGVKQAIDDGTWTDPDEDTTATDTVAGLAVDYIRRHTLSPETVKRYEGSLRMLKRYPIERPIGGMLLIDVEATDVQLMHTEMLEHHGKSTAAGAFRFVRSVLNDAVDRGKIQKAPIPKRKHGQASMAAVKRRSTIFLTAVQIAALRAFMPARYALMIDLAAYLGLRRGEVFGLRRRDVNLDARTITVAEQQDEPVDGVALRRSTKSSDNRGEEIPTFLHLDDVLAGAISDHLDEFAAPGFNGLLFTRVNGEPMTRAAFKMAFDKARSKAVEAGFLDEVEAKITFHGLRHLAASNLARTSGSSVTEVKRFLRQSSDVAALNYIKAHHDDHARLVSALASDYVADIGKVIPLRKKAS